MPASAIASTVAREAYSRWSAESPRCFATTPPAPKSVYWSAWSLTGRPNDRARSKRRPICAWLYPFASQKPSTWSTTPCRAASGRTSSHMNVT